ncbi:MAG TPA: caspase family protein [Pyrinomonadaceae bacterium]|nr:caspase family protein [Pyrinomonadaceae bacterium]
MKRSILRASAASALASLLLVSFVATRTATAGAVRTSAMIVPDIVGKVEGIDLFTSSITIRTSGYVYSPISNEYIIDRFDVGTTIKIVFNKETIFSNEAAFLTTWNGVNALRVGSHVRVRGKNPCTLVMMLSKEIVAKLGLNAAPPVKLEPFGAAPANRTGWVSASPRDVSAANAALVGRKYFALVIGNNNYHSMRSLRTGENDARAVEAMLRLRFGFDTTLLLNAPRREIMGAINQYRRRLDADSSLLIYYAGHGYFDKEVELGYWLPVDARPDDNSDWISADDVTKNLKGISAIHILVVSDSCYSGTFNNSKDPLASISTPAVRAQYLLKVQSRKSRTLMASGGNEPVADGSLGGNSIFAAAFLRGLNEMGQPIFTAAELFREHIHESVAGRANQLPEYNPLRNSGHDSGDFVFVKR